MLEFANKLLGSIDSDIASLYPQLTLVVLSDCSVQLLSRHQRQRMKFQTIVVLALVAFGNGVNGQQPRKLRNGRLAADRDLELAFFNVMAADMSFASEAPSPPPSEFL